MPIISTSGVSTSTPAPRDQRAEQLASGTYDNTAVCVYDGSLAITSKTTEVGNRIGLCADCADFDESIVHTQAAVYTANSIEAEALKTTDPAKNLGDILDALPEVLPEVLQKMGTAPDLAEAIRPEIAKRLRYMRDIHAARSTAVEAGREMWDIILGAIRKGSDPGDVMDQVVGLMEQKREARIDAWVDQTMGALREVSPGATS